MTKRKVMGVILATVCAFAVSFLWFSPLLFGWQFLELSGVRALIKILLITLTL